MPENELQTLHVFCMEWQRGRLVVTEYGIFKYMEQLEGMGTSWIKNPGSNSTRHCQKYLIKKDFQQVEIILKVNKAGYVDLVTNINK